MVEIKGKSKFDITKSMLDLEQQDIEIFYYIKIQRRIKDYSPTYGNLVSFYNPGWSPTNVHLLLELRVNTDMHAMAFLAG